jgi:competence protein ComEC
MDRPRLHRRYNRTTIALLLCAAILGGLVLARTHWQVASVWLWLLGAGAALSLKRRDALTVLAVIGFGLALGCWRGGNYLQQLQPYQALAHQPVVATGDVIIDAVYGYGGQLSFTVDHVTFLSPVQKSVPGRIKVSGFGANMVYRGDEVQFSGKLYPTRGANQASISYSQMSIIGSRPSFVDITRRKFTAGMQSALPEPAASFGLGLLVGQRNTLPDDVTQALLMVGLTHIIAVSGYNLTILLEASRRLLGKRSKFQSTMVALALIGLFLLFAGSSASIVRAAVISVIGLTAWYFGRTIKPVLLILLAAALTAFASPVYLWSDISWHLSFLAFFGVLVVAPQLVKRFFGGHQPGLLLQIVLESLCAELMTIPIILYIFGQMSFIGLLANMLVAALIPLAMLLSLVAGLAGMLIPAVAGWFAWPASVLLTYMLDIASLLSRIPHIFVQNVSLTVSGMVLLYACVLVVIGILWSREKRKAAILTDINE